MKGWKRNSELRADAESVIVAYDGYAWPRGTDERKIAQAALRMATHVLSLVEQLEALRGIEQEALDATNGFSALVADLRDAEAERDRLKEQLQTAERERDGLHLENDERGARINDLLEQLEAEGFTLELLRNGCEQALLLLDRDRFEEDPEAKVVRAVLRGALGESNPAKERP